jgi:hypothetical protein
MIFKNKVLSTIAKLILGLHGIKESKDITTDGKPITPQIVVFGEQDGNS